MNGEGFVRPEFLFFTCASFFRVEFLFFTCASFLARFRALKLYIAPTFNTVRTFKALWFGGNEGKREPISTVSSGYSAYTITRWWLYARMYIGSRDTTFGTGYYIFLPRTVGRDGRRASKELMKMWFRIKQVIC